MNGRDSGYLLVPVFVFILLGLFAAASADHKSGTTSNTRRPAVAAVEIEDKYTYAEVKRVGADALYPDAIWTPGAINTAITQATIGQTICNKNWSTKSVRDTQTSATQKNTVYVQYGIPHPQNNTGKNQMCELDHLISLELGGADTLNNIWPECGPAGVPLNQRYFKEKDAVENYLHAQVCAGHVSLAVAQSAITDDWYAIYMGMKGSASRSGATFDASDPGDE